MSMSMALRDVIPVMKLLKERKRRNFPVLCMQPIVYCKVFEDNSGALLNLLDSQSYVHVLSN